MSEVRLDLTETQTVERLSLQGNRPEIFFKTKQNPEKVPLIISEFTRAPLASRDHSDIPNTPNQDFSKVSDFEDLHFQVPKLRGLDTESEILSTCFPKIWLGY
ncbi:hypothetical protein KIL84_011614 [Mauremys mutica]|uniref:Uncharacterized protein n=1 Tax=Mauremys mutica TaxID=74926 RepID=A0A9D4AVI4_9SAUR|nr:hypothetical protein KIL84_011614 [Mauremys mutica]